MSIEDIVSVLGNIKNELEYLSNIGDPPDYFHFFTNKKNVAYLSHLEELPHITRNLNSINDHISDIAYSLGTIADCMSNRRVTKRRKKEEENDL